MTKEPVSINKILEIDMDTDRETQLVVRQVSAVMYNRERQPDPDRNIKDDMIILANALAAVVLKAEQDGVCKKGEGIRRAIEYLQDVYVDATAEVTSHKNDERGNKLNEQL